MHTITINSQDCFDLTGQYFTFQYTDNALCILLHVIGICQLCEIIGSGTITL